MKNIFKKSKPTYISDPLPVAQIPKTKKEKAQKIIEQIHFEFDSSTEFLLMEAKEIIANTKLDEKAERLRTIGFTSTKAVTETDEAKKKKEKSLILAQAIEYFSMHYPNYKFINEDCVATICKKYELKLGNASDYTGDIPEKNLAEIEAFKLREEDKQEYTQLYGLNLRSMRMYSMPRPRYVNRWDMLSNHLLSEEEIEREKQAAASTPETEPEIIMPRHRPEFMIVAPRQDFRSSLWESSDGYTLIEDPIVLQPVKGGYLIVSKWGLEGNDPSLTNEKMN